MTAPPEPARNSPAEAASSERRRRAQELLASQRSQLDQLERTLSDKLQTIADEVAREAANPREHDSSNTEDTSTAALSGQAEALLEQVAALERELARLRGDQEPTLIQLGKLEQELRIKETLLAEAHAQQQAKTIELASVQEQLTTNQAELTAARAMQETLHQELAAVREQASTAQEGLAAQRKKQARDLKSQHAETVTQVETQKAEAIRWREAAEKHEAETAALAREIEFLKAKCQADQAEVAQWKQTAEEARADYQRAIDSAQKSSGSNPADTETIQKLEREKSALTKRLLDAEGKLKEAAKQKEDMKGSDELTRRLEMALEDLRETKRQNSELESKLAKAKSGIPAGGGGGGSMDWEAQKRRLLESLEADDSDDEASVEERNTIEGTIRITDQIVAQKDEEIAELKHRLDGQAEPESTEVVGAAALADMLDRDELVRQEREKLQLVQAEWREKIGKAEIDISVERAKIARDRAELEERIRQYQAEQITEVKNGEAPDPSGKPARGRWLARLGLKDMDEKS